MIGIRRAVLLAGVAVAGCADAHVGRDQDGGPTDVGADRCALRISDRVPLPVASASVFESGIAGQVILASSAGIDDETFDVSSWVEGGDAPVWTAAARDVDPTWSWLSPRLGPGIAPVAGGGVIALWRECAADSIPPHSCGPDRTRARFIGPDGAAGPTTTLGDLQVANLFSGARSLRGTMARPSDDALWVAWVPESGTFAVVPLTSEVLALPPRLLTLPSPLESSSLTVASAGSGLAALYRTQTSTGTAAAWIAEVGLDGRVLSLEEIVPGYDDVGPCLGAPDDGLAYTYVASGTDTAAPELVLRHWGSSDATRVPILAARWRATHCAWVGEQVFVLGRASTSPARTELVVVDAPTGSVIASEPQTGLEVAMASAGISAALLTATDRGEWGLMWAHCE